MSETGERTVNRKKWMYHHTLAPKGKIFEQEEITSLDETWVDTPAKFPKKEAVKETDDEAVNKKEEIPSVISEASESVEDETPTQIISEVGQQVAEILLKSEGLNHSSFMRGLGKDSKKMADRKETKEEYEAILASYKGKIKKQGNDWLLTNSE